MDETRSILSQSILWTIGVILAIAAVVGGFYWFNRGPETPPAPAPVAAPPPVAEVTAPAPAPAPKNDSGAQYPIDDTDSDHTTRLDQSDKKVLEALAQVSGWNTGALRLILPTDIVRHFVATVDALPHEKLPLIVLPTKPVPGAFRVAVHANRGEIDPENSARYAAFVRALTVLDTAQLVSVYRHFYPLFQQSYKELGYPKGYFNDRFVEVLDELIEAPEPRTPIAVVAPGVMFHYVDPDLEDLPAGQKVLVRIGAANERVVKSRLREIRQSIVTP